MTRVRIAVVSVLVALLVVVLAGCASPTGSLTVTVSGLPGGVVAAVSVTGPGGYSATVTATQTLSNLTPGSYTVSPGNARASGAIVDTLYLGSGGGTVAVTGGATATAAVSYAKRTGSGMMWVADEGAGVSGFTASQLASSGSPTPAVALSSSDGPDGLALDADGNLWVGMGNSYTLVEFTASQLASSSTPTPHVVISSDGTSLAWPGSLAFDPSGNLWVGNCAGSGNVEMYTPSQLAATGSPSPSVSLSGSYAACNAIAFDATGDLWIGDTSNDQVLEFTPSQLATSGSPTPTVTLTSAAFASPEGLAFDASGNLWVANDGSSGAGALVMFTASQLASSGSKTPSVTIGDDGSGNLFNPVYVVLDNGGNLWVSDFSKNNILEFAAGDIGTSGTPAAKVVLTGFSYFNFPQFLFDPPAP